MKVWVWGRVASWHTRKNCVKTLRYEIIATRRKCALQLTP